MRNPRLLQAKSIAFAPDVQRDNSEQLTVELPFLNDNGARIKLSGIYRKQQTPYDVHRIRYYLQEDGYGKKALNILCDYVVGAHGIQVKFGDPVLDELWKSWRPDPMHPYMTFGELQRFMVKSLARDGEYIYQMMGDWAGFYCAPMDILDLPLTSKIQAISGPYSHAVGLQGNAYQGIDRDNMKRPIQYNFWPDEGSRGPIHSSCKTGCP